MTGAFCGREEFTERFVAVGGLAAAGWLLIGTLPDAGAGDEALGDEGLADEFGAGWLPGAGVDGGLGEVDGTVAGAGCAGPGFVPNGIHVEPFALCPVLVVLLLTGGDTLVDD
jgi:hypothetical protein